MGQVLQRLFFYSKPQPKQDDDALESVPINKVDNEMAKILTQNESYNKGTLLYALPKEILLIVLKQLPTCKELWNFQQASKRVYNLFKQNETDLWRQMYYNMGNIGKCFHSIFNDQCRKRINI